MSHTTKYLKNGLSAILVAAVLALTGCASDAEPDRPESSSTETSDNAPENSADSTVAHGVLGELGSIDGQIAVGESIAVLVDLPASEWTVTNSNEDVVEVRGADSDEDASIVNLVGVAPGEAVIVFEGQADIRDEITVEVVDE